MNNDDHLRYPVGKFTPKESYTSEEIHASINALELLPAEVERIAAGFTEKQLNTPYREGGWTARQVLHHLADSHLNMYIRLKWTLTEETPTIKAYDEKLWAETPEVSVHPKISIDLLKAVHTKIVALARLLSSEDLNRSFFHPETKKHVALNRMIALYAWHGAHHLGHLRIISEKS